MPFLRLLSPKLKLKPISQLAFLMLVKFSIAQDIEQTARSVKNTLHQEVLETNGNITTSLLVYNSKGISPRRDPYYYSVNANLNFTLFKKVSVPFSALISKQNQTYTNGLANIYSHPLNQFGLSPSYKWLTLHAGFRSVQFSEFSLSGALFLGGGIEINPKKSLVSGTAIYGRFVKPVTGTAIDNTSSLQPAYARWGGGSKIKVGTASNFFELIFLKIKDDPYSIPFDTSLTNTPQENEIIEVNTKQKITNQISASCDVALSLFTKNLYDETYSLSSFSYINQIYSVRPSSQFNKAINATVDYTPGKFKIGTKYKRIDPDFSSLGAVFITNDVEEISANVSSSVLDNKLNLDIAAGLQRNNLDKIQVMTSRRIITAFNVAYSLNELLNISAVYSNFSANTAPVRNVLNDSLEFLQVTENTSANMNYMFGNDDYKHSISTNVSYMQVNGNVQHLTTFFTQSLLYTLQHNQAGFRFNLSFLYNKGNSSGQSSAGSLGPGAGIQQSFYRNKVQLGFNFGFQNVNTSSNQNSNNYMYTLTASYRIDKHQALKLNSSFLKRITITNKNNQFEELRCEFSYSYNFGVTSKKLFKN